MSKESENTVFHKIMRREIPATMLHDDEDVIAIKDISPAAPTHLLIIPRKSIPSVNALTPEDDALVGKMVRVAQELAASEGIAPGGYRLVMNCGDDGGQTVAQLHLHLIGGREMAWPPG